MLSELGVAFGFGFVGSVHCAQMCGPIVLSYSLASPGAPRSLALSHAFYNLGRTLTYTLLGAIAGTAGGMIGSAANLVGVEKGAMLVAGVLMVIGGLMMSGLIPSGGLLRIGGTGLSARLFHGAGRLISSPHPASKLGLGLVLGLLPCGLLWAAMLKAAGTGSPLNGALTMAAFGLGTAGALGALGAFSSLIGARLGRFSNALAAASIIVVGALLVWRGLSANPLQMRCH
jgi:hypothetical protein